MSDIMEHEPSRSVEFDLDRDIQQLIAKMAAGSLSSDEQADYISLLSSRSRLMMPTLGRGTAIGKNWRQRAAA